jgi:hypothetical protein
MKEIKKEKELVVDGDQEGCAESLQTKSILSD